jgi:hypothetical protein
MIGGGVGRRSMMRSPEASLRSVTILVLIMVLSVACSPQPETETAATEEIQILIDDYLAAFNSYDGGAFLELVTDNYVLDMVGAGGEFAQDAEETAQMIEGLEEHEWKEAVVGEPMMSGNDSWPRYVSQVEHFTAAPPGYGPDGADGISTFTIVDDGGTLKIARHDYVGNN